MTSSTLMRRSRRQGAFFESIDVLSVPTTYREPKGLYFLEAWANGVPVVQPRHGTFPELIEETGGGLAVDRVTRDLRMDCACMLEDHALRDGPGAQGGAVRERFTAGRMARGVVSVLEHAARLSYTPDMTHSHYPPRRVRRHRHGRDRALRQLFPLHGIRGTGLPALPGSFIRVAENGVRWGLPRVSAHATSSGLLSSRMS